MRPRGEARGHQGSAPGAWAEPDAWTNPGTRAAAGAWAEAGARANPGGEVPRSPPVRSCLAGPVSGNLLYSTAHAIAHMLCGLGGRVNQKGTAKAEGNGAAGAEES